MSDATVEQQTFTDLMDIHRHYTHRTQEDNDKAIEILLDKINDPEKINSLIVILLSTVSVVPMDFHQVGEGLLLHRGITHVALDM